MLLRLVEAKWNLGALTAKIKIETLNQPTRILHSFLEPIKSDHNNDNVDEAYVTNDGYSIDHKLLVYLQRFEIDTTLLLAQRCPSKFQLEERGHRRIKP
jgi:hypothetical protein